MADLPSHARVVIIGGGVGGCSIAYHLTKMGWKDAILLERHELTAGSTWHSAGLVGQLRSDANLTRMMYYSTDLYRRLKDTPMVAGVSLKRSAIESFQKTLADTFYVMIFFNLVFSSIIAGGVVYNAARVSLSERSRELASLRVLGFTRGEISFILLGELAAVTLMAIPVGMVMGYAFAGLLVAAFNTELYRFPLVVSPRTFAYAACSVLVAAALSGLAVRRRLDHLDLVAVLKTRE